MPAAPRRTGEARRPPGLRLSSSLELLPRVQRERLTALRRLGLNTVNDLVWHLPRRHEDQRLRMEVALLRPGMAASVRARLVALNARRARYRRMDLVEGTVEDPTGQLDVIWFNQPHLRHLLRVGQDLILFGKVVGGRSGRLQLRNPEVAREGAEGSGQTLVGGLQAVYPETFGLTSRWLRPQIRTVIEAGVLAEVEDPLPGWLVKQEGLAPLEVALRQVHLPQSEEELRQARARLGFDDLFYPQLAALISLRHRLSLPGVRSRYQAQVARDFVASLPFQLTDDQRRAAHQILLDMDRPIPMNRLLQGDVGSGKTVVAAMAARMAIASGHQVMLMAPTEILARQHHQTLTRLLESSGIRPLLLVGSTKAKARREILSNLAVGEEPLLVGTHALVEEQVQLPNLALSIVDEQHRFGVDQRLRLRSKVGARPDFLAMSATPIPRSLASTLYGHLDISQLRQRPPGRAPVTTAVIEADAREAAYDLIRAEVAMGRQGFVICPLIEDSPAIEARSVVAEHRRLEEEVFSGLRLGLLHGKLSALHKAQVMERFAAGDFDILVTTSLIEVGLDLPNASFIAIEDAGRFGLAQLHQLRGRVGRGEHPSHCLLFAEAGDATSRRRLQALVDHQDGFEVAEMDLTLRGPGDQVGLKQHGRNGPDLRVDDLLDPELRGRARRAAELVLERDSNLRDPGLREALRRYQLVTDID